MKEKRSGKRKEQSGKRKEQSGKSKGAARNYFRIPKLVSELKSNSKPFPKPPKLARNSETNSKPPKCDRNSRPITARRSKKKETF